MALDAETIQRLLKGELAKVAKSGIKDINNKLPRPTQFGPLGWSDKTSPCTSRGCSSPTYIRVRGAAYCTTHAIYVLNQIILQEVEHMDLSFCTCKAGIHSKGNIHTYDCELVKISPTDVFTPEPESDLL